MPESRWRGTSLREINSNPMCVFPSLCRSRRVSLGFSPAGQRHKVEIRDRKAHPPSGDGGGSFRWLCSCSAVCARWPSRSYQACLQPDDAAAEYLQRGDRGPWSNLAADPVQRPTSAVHYRRSAGLNHHVDQVQRRSPISPQGNLTTYCLHR